MQPFEVLFSSSRMVCRPGAVAGLADEVRKLGLKRLMMVSGTRSARSQAAHQVRQALGSLIAAECSGIPSHSGVAQVTALADSARQHQIDGFIAVGGGSASDSAKAAAILLAEGGSLPDHANVFTPPDHYVQRVLPARKLPIIAVPTTLSAAEITPGLGIRDDHGHKLVFWDPGVVPRLIVLDERALSDVPAEVLTTTGMNALAHCIEGLYSKVRNPVSEALALRGIRLLHGALPRVWAAGPAEPGAASARGEALVGASLSGLVISNARVGIHHGVCHGLGSLGGLAHGVANSVLLPHAMRFNREVAAQPLALAAQEMGVDTRGLTALQAADAAVQAVESLQQAIGVPRRLSQTGLDRALLPRLARGAMSDRGLYFNPRLATEAEVQALLEAAW
jgi:alcohol dehydrogenase